MNRVEFRRRIETYIAERLRVRKKQEIDSQISVIKAVEGAASLEEAIERLYDLADKLELLQHKGLKLAQPFKDGCGTLQKG